MSEIHELEDCLPDISAQLVTVSYLIMVPERWQYQRMTQIAAMLIERVQNPALQQSMLSSSSGLIRKRDDVKVWYCDPLHLIQDARRARAAAIWTDLLVIIYWAFPNQFLVLRGKFKSVQCYLPPGLRLFDGEEISKTSSDALPLDYE